MSADLRIAHALIVADAAGPRAVAKSADFPFAWEDAALTAAVRFGRRPPGVACPPAVFAVPVGAKFVAVVQVSDVPGGGSPLGLRFLIVSRRLYEGLGGDPFLIADRFPPDWAARGDLLPLEWPMEAAPPRAVEAVRDVLKHGDTPLLLGAAQALLDGGRLLVPADQPGTTVRDLWKLLPHRSRCELWPATFAFSVELGFSAAVVPVAPDPWPVEYLTPDQARDYPEGKYELALQTAAEAGDQGELDRLFARRSSGDTVRLAAGMFALAVVVAVVSKLIS